MTELATPGQLRLSYLRWALVTIPAILLLGSISAMASKSRYNLRWFDALDLPPTTPADWVFALVWPLLLITLGLALAMVLHARGAKGRGRALALFAVQLLAVLAWSPLFFGRHQVTTALYLMGFTLVIAVAATSLFATIRRAAAWVLIPYLLWLGFMTLLNFQIDARNPDAETLVPHAASTQI